MYFVNFRWRVLRHLPFVLVVAMSIVVTACGGDPNGGFRDDHRTTGQFEQSASSDNSVGGSAQESIAQAPTTESGSGSGAGEDSPKLPGRNHGNSTHGIWPQVWSQHAPGIKSWEYKVNCGDASSHTDPCFLSDLTSVRVTTPSGELIELEKDFNTNDFSGEITRRWVLYGPQDGELPVLGDYVFSYSRGSELLYEQVVPYESDVISYPAEVEWKRSANDMVVTWNPPPEVSKGMHYKAIIWQVEDTPELSISDVFDWDAATGVLRNVPLIVGGKYSLNVAIFFDDGYAYSEYVILEWPEPGETGY